jgi:hypothetical protein
MYDCRFCLLLLLLRFAALSCTVVSARNIHVNVPPASGWPTRRRFECFHVCSSVYLLVQARRLRPAPAAASAIMARPLKHRAAMRAACAAAGWTERQRERIRARILVAGRRRSSGCSCSFVGRPIKQLFRASAKLLFIDATLA